MTRTTLPEKVVALEVGLVDIPHAFGGALALAYYAEPRATIDIDLNVFLPEGRAQEVADALMPLGVTGNVDRASRDGQARWWWDENPIDLFFSYDRFHEAAARAVRVVPFAETTIPILAADHLVVCKVVFDRAKDWVDIDAMRDEGTYLDVAEILRWVGRICGDTDPRYDRVAAVLSG